MSAEEIFFTSKLASAYERVGEVQEHYLLNNLGETSNALHSYQKMRCMHQDLSSSSGSSWQDKVRWRDATGWFGTNADSEPRYFPDYRLTSFTCFLFQPSGSAS